MFRLLFIPSFITGLIIGVTSVWFSIAAEYRVDSINAIADDSVKKKVVTAAREEWEVYFSRLFPAAVREQDVYSVITPGES